MNFWLFEAICVAAQLILFTPFWLKWQKDCKEIGKDNLAVPLSKRFLTWLVFFPFWAIPLFRLGGGEQ